jgi:hypothetical protein
VRDSGRAASPRADLDPADPSVDEPFRQLEEKLQEPQAASIEATTVALEIQSRSASAARQTDLR